MSATRPKCMYCGKPADYICTNCGKAAICEEEDDNYCPNCGEENGIWDEYKEKPTKKKK